jgi:hypothetical protein
MTWSTHARSYYCTLLHIDEDTQLSLRKLLYAVTVYVPLRNVHPIEVCLVDQSKGPIRKDLAVHVSLSSIFTLSKNRPQVPRGKRRRRTKTLAGLPGSKVCPFYDFAEQWGPQSPTSSALAGYMIVTNDCQHPILKFRKVSIFQRFVSTFESVSAPPRRALAGYRSHPFLSQQPKSRKCSFFETSCRAC